MFEKNLKYYRLKKGFSKKELATLAGLTPMAISNYESGNRKPDMDILKRLAEVLEVRVSDFLKVRNEKLDFCHGEFRKNSSMSQKEQEFVREYAEEYLGRFFTVIEILGGEVLAEAPGCHGLKLGDNPEEDGIAMRRYLNIPSAGPVPDIAYTLENKGILLLDFKGSSDKFSGINGTVNDRPYVMYNAFMSPERNRSTITHELAHLLFRWPEDMSEKEVEERATAISGAFLFPKEDAIRELGIRRSFISKDMEIICREYGISMMLLTKRAQLAGIVTDSAAKEFYMRASSMGWRKNEPVRIQAEQPVLFKQLVYRAINEEEISIQRGAELLGVSYGEIVNECCFNEGIEDGVYQQRNLILMNT